MGGKIKGRENDEEDVSSYWMTLRKREYTAYWKRKHYNCTVWRTRFERGYRPVLRQTAEWLPSAPLTEHRTSLHQNYFRHDILDIRCHQHRLYSVGDRWLKYECGTLVAWYLGENRSARRENATQCDVQNISPHALDWDWARASAVRGRRLTAWYMARPVVILHPSTILLALCRQCTIPPNCRYYS
jgi:hypothetical protein